METLGETIVLGNSLTQWLTALAATLGTYLVLTVLPRWVARRLHRRAEKTGTWGPALVAHVLELTKLFFRAVTAVYVGSTALTLPLPIQRPIWIVFVLALTAQVAIWVTRAVVSRVEEAWKKRRGELRAEELTELRWISFAVKAVVWIIAALVALENIGVDVSALAAGLGIGGIAVALAVQRIIADLFASLSIVMDKPFVLGDYIVVGDQMGSVEKIGLKTTRIRSLSGEEIAFSNSDLLQSRVHNYGRMEERRIAFSFGVVYQTSAAELSDIPALVREIIEARIGARFDRAHFKEFGDSGLLFEVVYYVKSPDYRVYMDVQQEINLELFRRLEERKIDFAYPTRTVFLAGGPSVGAGAASPRTSG
jgi:small-conductance mechanosensitive channel